MSDYADDLVKRWEMNDPRDRWRHTGEAMPSTKVRNSDIAFRPAAVIQDRAAPAEADRDTQRMLVCDVCGAPALSGSDVTIDGIRMGDVGSWRCAEHQRDISPSYSREQWAAARAEGRLYPDHDAGEWQELDARLITKPSEESAA